MNLPVINFMGMRFHNVTAEGAVRCMEEFIQSGTPHKVFCPNVHLYVWARSNPDLWRFYQECDLVTVDGMGIYFASRLLGVPVAEAVVGAMLMFDILRRSAECGYRVFLLGTTDEILEKAVGNIRRDYPGVNVVGAHHGFYTEEQEGMVADRIRASDADIVFLAMSSPKKEWFAKRQAARSGARVLLGVGGGIDILAGVYKLPPEWVRRSGLWWLYRLLQEPRRLWKRYLVTNSIFLGLVTREFVLRRLLRMSP
jgi:N-acetylglucosaminyldiphosphoundecaprenol N-acetyl-beta-D-mannosaminyltransferase